MVADGGQRIGKGGYRSWSGRRHSAWAPAGEAGRGLGDRRSHCHINVYQGRFPARLLPLAMGFRPDVSPPSPRRIPHRRYCNSEQCQRRGGHAMRPPLHVYGPAIIYS